MPAEAKWMAVAIHQRLRDQQAIATSDLELIVLGYCSKLLFHRCKLVSWCIQRDPKGSEIMERYVPLTVVLLVITMGCALARDYGYHNSPEISEWFKNMTFLDRGATEVVATYRIAIGRSLPSRMVTI